jgi:hypothetical protein
MDEIEESKLFTRFRLNLERIINESIKEAKADYHLGPTPGNIVGDIEIDIKRAKKNAAKCALKDAEQLVAYINREYKKELNIKLGWPTKWMLRDKRLMKNLDRYPCFFPVLRYLINHSYKQFTDSQELADKVGFGKHKHILKSGDQKGEEKEYHYVLVQVDKERLINSLGKDRIQISKSYIQKYIKAFDDIGILKKLGKHGSHGNNLYAIGYWRTYKGNSMKREWFLSETKEFKERLRNFNL